MTEEQHQLLRSCSKDEKAFEDLKAAFTALSNECERSNRNLWLLEQAIKNDYDSILITDIELVEGGPRIVYVNEGFTKMTGYTRDEAIGQTPRILQGPKTDKGTLAHLKKSLIEGHSFFGQAVNYRKDGSEFINQWDIHPIYNDKGELTHWVSYQHDITTKKRAEATYVEQSADFDSMEELSKRTLVDFDPEGRIIYANKAFRALSGYEKEELGRMSIWDVISNRHAHSLRARFAAVDQPNELEKNKIKTVITHKSGLPIQVEISCHHHELTEGRLIRANIQNLTLQKRILKTLNKRNINFSSLVEKNSDFTYHLISEPSGHIHFDWVSDTFGKVTGHSPEKGFTADGWRELIHADDLHIVKDHLGKVLSGKSTVTEYRLVDANGNEIKVIDYGKPVMDPNTGKVVSVSGAIMDVTKDRYQSTV
jgi:PAS domain S-box-containing protein